MRSILAMLALLACGTAQAQQLTPTTPPPLTGYATLSVLVASLQLSTATVGPNSPAFPTVGAPNRFMEVKNANTSANILYVCPLGGTCTAAVGIPLAVGETKSWYVPPVNGATTFPTVISAGTATAIVSW